MMNLSRLLNIVHELALNQFRSLKPKFRYPYPVAIHLVSLRVDCRHWLEMIKMHVMNAQIASGAHRSH